jgi:uncharacterized membrane protein
VIVMRFSSIFQSLPTPRRETRRDVHRPAGDASTDDPAVPPPQPVATKPASQQQQQPQPHSPPPAHELPDDLDARVRLIGEWQLGEG